MFIMCVNVKLIFVGKLVLGIRANGGLGSLFLRNLEKHHIAGGQTV